jgi:hypothetical protein
MSNIKYMDLFTERVYDDLVVKIMLGMSFGNKKNMEKSEFEVHVNANLNKYMNDDELKCLILEQIGTCEHEELNAMVIQCAILIVYLNVHIWIKNSLLDESFTDDNPFSPISNPKAFIISKYFHEQFGMDTQIIDFPID